MQEVILWSTLLLTLLLLVGLFFFLRASVKDRTERMELEFELQPSQLTSKLCTYLEKRAYQLIEKDDRLVFTGVVAPSRFLAVFLTLLAFLGLVCLSLILSTLLPQASLALGLLPLASPLAGFFYWAKARRSERVVARIQDTAAGCRLLIEAHRDEILTLRRKLEASILK